jgi:hypothetical protein
VTEFDAWDQQTARLLQDAYLAAGAGPRGSGSTHSSAGEWRAKRQHLAVPMDMDGTWLDVGCANGHLLATLPTWASERGITIRAHGLELMPPVADLARRLHAELADRIWTGSVMTWTPPQRFTYVTALTEAVPTARLGELVGRLLNRFVEDEGRLIVSSYANAAERPRALFDELVAVGHAPDGEIRIDWPGRTPLITAWLDA